jgi:hypothetical protein
MILHATLSIDKDSGLWSVGITERILDPQNISPCGWPDNNERTVFTHGMDRGQALAKVRAMMLEIEWKNTPNRKSIAR